MTKAAKRVFLSYARVDEKKARALSAHLTKAGLEVWDPEIQILPGDDRPEALKQALEESDSLVVLLSPGSDSPWLQYEIEYALGQERFRGRLIPVMVRETKEFPWILERFRILKYQNPKTTSQQILAALKASSDAPQKSIQRCSVYFAFQPECDFRHSLGTSVDGPRSALFLQHEEH